MKTKSPRIFTVGHSNRSWDEFVTLLKDYKLKLVIDVRTVPKSRHNPQFTGSKMHKKLEAEGIEYIHMEGLGGWRPTHRDSKNKAWRNSSFRGYADYMQSEEFAKNLQRLINKSKRKRLVVMCAEAVPWRCHRSLIADALLAQGHAVEEILSPTSHRHHKMTSFARVRKGQVTYPAPN